LRIGSWKETKENREEGKLRWPPQQGHRQKASTDEEAPIGTPLELREQRSELGNRNTISSSLDYDVENKLLIVLNILLEKFYVMVLWDIIWEFECKIY
jgi:hypothetical protein